MAIKHIDDIYIDGRNRAFGGYIYSISYDANFGEQPSTLVVEVANESGIYDISKADLNLTGAANLIKIGSKITLYMYPITYSLKKSPSGKLLRIEYVDESISYLDKKVVKLKTRGLEAESYANTIVVGIERINAEPVNPTVADQVFADDQENAATNAALLQVTDVEYKFSDLLTKISAFTGVSPTLDDAAENYYRDYSGKLREVLSAWCNDLGLGFYWENRKLNFIDLRNPATLSAVELYASQVKNANNILESDETYSLRDTFCRGSEVFFGKDGQILDNTTSADGEPVNYAFNNLKLEDVFINSLNFKSTNALFIEQYKACYYGINPFLALILSDISLNNPTNNPMRDVFTWTPVTDTDIKIAITANTKLAPSYTNYNWYRVVANPTKDLGVTFSKLQAYAKFYGRFYFYRMSTEERAKLVFGSDVKFYKDKTPLTKVTEIATLLQPLAENITNFNTVCIRGFINGDPNDSALVPDSPAFIEGSSPSGDGYVIKEIEPVWTPRDASSLDFGQMVIIEGRDSDSLYKDTDGSPMFYFGIVQSIPIGTFRTSIQRPVISTVYETVQSFPRVNFSLGGYADKIEYTSYTPPKTANVNYYDLNQSSLSEEQVLGSSAYYFNDLDTTREAFDNAVTDLVKSTLFDQTDPFFSLSLNIANIDLAGPSLSLGRGLQGFSVSFGENGVSTNYSFGNEKMRLRNPDVFYRYSYDPALKRQVENQVGHIYIRRGGARGN